MDSVKTRIEEIQKEIDSHWNSLRQDAYALASQAACLDEGEVTLISPTLRQNFLTCQKKTASLRGRKGQRDELVRRLNEGQRSVSKLQKEKTQGEHKIKELEVLIGAVAFAQAGSADCDEEVRQALAGRLEESERLQKAAEGSSVLARLGRLRLSVYQKRQKTVFTGCFAALEGAGLLDRLTGSRATELVASYRSIRDSLSRLDQDIENRKHRLSASQLEMDGDDGLDGELRQAEAELQEAGVAYGMHLFDNGYKWIGPGTGESFLDLVQHMLFLQGEIDGLEKRIREEKEYSAIADFSSMIAFNNSKIADLEAEMERIREQIAAIQEDNRALERKIANVKERLR